MVPQTGPSATAAAEGKSTETQLTSLPNAIEALRPSDGKVAVTVNK